MKGVDRAVSDKLVDGIDIGRMCFPPIPTYLTYLHLPALPPLSRNYNVTKGWVDRFYLDHIHLK